jgi:hypothetical protein
MGSNDSPHRPLRVLTVLLFCSAACSRNPASPSKPLGRPADVAPLKISCAIDPLSVRCAASVFGVGDVTSQTRWWASEQFVFPTESTDVIFFGAGLVTALQPADVYIRGEYRTAGGGTLTALAPHSYHMVPGQTPVPLAYLTGQVNVPGLGGATVEIVDGEGAGKRDVTRDNGFFMIEHLRFGTPFTVRASKDGYAPEVKSNSGIIDDVYGFPSNNTINFTLAPVPPS